MASSRLDEYNTYLVARTRAPTHAYWFYTRGSSIYPRLIAPEDRDELWHAVEGQDEERINQELLSDAFRTLLHRGFNAIHPHHEPVFRWSEVDFHVSSMIPEGRELTHDIVNGQEHRFYIESSGFWARSADRRHQIRLIFGWRPGDEPYPQSIQIRYIGPQRFHTTDNEFYRLLQENMQGPHS
jgi:hypothetical protein